MWYYNYTFKNVCIFLDESPVQRNRNIIVNLDSDSEQENEVIVCDDSDVNISATCKLFCIVLSNVYHNVFQYLGLRDCSEN